MTKSLESDWTGGFFLKKKNWHIESSTSHCPDHSEKVGSHSIILSKSGWQKWCRYLGPGPEDRITVRRAGVARKWWQSLLIYDLADLRAPQRFS
jgi:hypothetical protein